MKYLITEEQLSTIRRSVNIIQSYVSKSMGPAIRSTYDRADRKLHTTLDEIEKSQIIEWPRNEPKISCGSIELHGCSVAGPQMGEGIKPQTWKGKKIFFNQLDLKWEEDLKEKQRTYHYPDGSKEVIINPLALNVQPSSMGGHAHRIVTLNDQGEYEGHYIRSGWNRITWINKQQQ